MVYIIIAISSFLFGVYIGLRKSYTQVLNPETKSLNQSVYIGQSQFIEPITAKEKFNNAKSIGDILQ